jgi:hypothetical protein
MRLKPLRIYSGFDAALKRRSTRHTIDQGLFAAFEY